MMQFQGIWLPDNETHLTAWMKAAGEMVDGKGTYQIKKLRAAIAFCAQTRTALDVGGHAGMWSMQLAKVFDHVEAFEPVAAHRECWHKNLYDVMNASIHAVALGAAPGSIRMHTAPTSSGDSWVAGEGNIPMVTLDSLGCTEVDFLKIDVEGSELNVLRGAEQTIKTWMPVIIVEQKPGHAQRFGYGEKDAIPYLESLGYKMVKEMSGDFIMVHGNK